MKELSEIKTPYGMFPDSSNEMTKTTQYQIWVDSAPKEDSHGTLTYSYEIPVDENGFLIFRSNKCDICANWLNLKIKDSITITEQHVH